VTIVDALKQSMVDGESARARMQQRIEDEKTARTLMQKTIDELKEERDVLRKQIDDQATANGVTADAVASLVTAGIVTTARIANTSSAVVRLEDAFTSVLISTTLSDQLHASPDPALVAMVGSMHTTLNAAVPTDGLELWVSAESLKQLDGSGVSQWPDLSGNKRHLTAKSGGDPKFISTFDGANGFPMVSFDSKGSAFKVPPIRGVGNMDPRTIIIAVHHEPPVDKDYTNTNNELFGISTGQMIDLGVSCRISSSMGRDGGVCISVQVDVKWELVTGMEIHLFLNVMCGLRGVGMGIELGTPYMLYR
jgi:hypothetical protein